jgi:hypothetical protein
MTHEEELVRAFIDPRRKERYLGFIASSKLRKRFLQELAHFKHLDIRYAEEVNLTTAQLAALLKEMRVPDVCWVVSENPKIRKSMESSCPCLLQWRNWGAIWGRSSHSCLANLRTSRTKMAAGCCNTRRTSN